MMNNLQNFYMNNNFPNLNNNINPFLNQNNTIFGPNNITNNNINNFNNQDILFNQFQQNPNINFPNQKQNNQINNNQNLNRIINLQQNSEEDLRNKIQKKNFEMKLDNFWIDINQIGLLNDIIDFYHKTKNDYLDINQKVQIMNIINRLNPNISSLKTNNEILDPLYYIKKPKKLIKFINSDFNLFTVKVPIFINKYDLYSIARPYKFLPNTKILLIHKNIVIDEDESSIDFISDGDIVIIIENRNYPDDSYYISLMKNNPCNKLINISFNIRFFNTTNLNFWWKFRRIININHTAIS